ncbi:nucleotidyltransferase domain-containing protein [Kribbella sp. NBC_00889]|uniref:nucleotidyltransferase domain-containing protein n=1 Tax=Kribbella sp. NBC_00889 TaxID=2975974 RepID=UPI00386935D4|nr:nucleotidyltransferase domain-containing protein [Kribbella sp. NBC_00889]
MFTVEERLRLRNRLIEAAEHDDRIDGAALTGSAAAGAEDEWSDIDLAFGLADGADQAAVLDDWTGRMYGDHGCMDHLDMRVRGTIYRVFLLRNTLQVDIAFAPAGEFGALGPAFALLFGEASEQQPFAEAVAKDLIGMAWLYALHARSSIARGKDWQAEYMISGLRDHLLALMCLRHGVPTSQGRGFHLLPEAITKPVEDTLVRSLDTGELTRAFGASIDVLLPEIEAADPGLATKLAGPLRALATPR